MSLWPRTINILISNWSRTRKFSQSFKNTSREDTFLTIVTRWSRSTTVQFLCPGWSKFDRWVHAENLYNILKLVYFDSWSWQSFLSTWCFLPSFSTGCIKWNTAAINSLLLVMVCIFDFWLRNVPLVIVGNPISDDIVFVFHLAGCGLKSPSSDSGLTWFGASRMVSLSNYFIQPWSLVRV